MILTDNRFPLFGIMCYASPMPVSPQNILLLLIGLMAAPAFAADAPQKARLNKAEQHSAFGRIFARFLASR
jgi:hypothetical protein